MTGVEGGLDDSGDSPNITTIPDSSFFKEHQTSTLPTPAEVRADNEEAVKEWGNWFNRPPPIKYPSLGLFVKYRANTTVVEAETQHMVYKQLRGKVPVPEVFGWTEDVFLSSHRNLAGPFHGADAVQKFQEGCYIQIDGDVPVVFTHDDLVPPNIMLSSGPNPKVVAVIDWGQAGWYPAYWEYCKAHRVRVNPDAFDDVLYEEWITRYLPIILDPVDDETVYHPWLWFVLSKGI
ncbi:uncharacterized protein N7515_004446 [Penicillium bovifimosum]|uniref:Aminoglycoside phosphotransferase domain-containing protein n=1 Tax=Penicillium bovifimosum TaxID=126998 RepID=A0A9W9L3C8_9EURO|nr:uncharacterized protein N7515_004446 [Penicillium bovifimosum]KAJ5135168.1 hypothetical protein N7515_004446 [Penicillium bovifimosum]